VGPQVIAAPYFLALLLGQSDTGLGGTLSDMNFPAVALLATSGVVGLIFIVRWMIRFQREFTNFYIEENNKLRARIDDLETEVLAKDAKITASTRELLAHERDSDLRIRVLERTIAEHEVTIASHERTIAEMQRRLGE